MLGALDQGGDQQALLQQDGKQTSIPNGVIPGARGGKEGVPNAVIGGGTGMRHEKVEPVECVILSAQVGFTYAY